MHTAINGLLCSLDLSARSGTPIEMHSEFGKMSLEVTGITAFRVHLFNPRQPQSPLIDAIRAVLAPPPSGSVLQMLNILVPIYAPGYDTSAIGLSWTIYQLASKPAIQAKIIAEVDAFGQQQPSRKDLAAFPFTEACFREAMRLNPPVNPLLPQTRQAKQDTVLGGYHILKGSVVAMNALGQHTDKTLFPELEVYRPERFVKGSPDGPESRHPFAELSFGAGPHRCIGYRFSMEEAVFALVRMFQRFTFSCQPSIIKALGLWL